MQRLGFFGIYFFSLSGVSWVLLYLVKETLLGWHGYFMGKVRKKLGKQHIYVYFGQCKKK